MVKHFYIFRNGLCPLNESGCIQGQCDNSGLNSQGIRQAEHTADYLSDKNISLIVSSPMKRALQTARIISSRTKAPILIDNRFIEVNLGIIDGIKFKLSEKRFSDIFSRWCSNSDCGIRFKGGESKGELRRRIFSGLTYYAQNSLFQNIGISGHSIAISQILQYLSQDITEVPNGSILHISYNSHHWRYNEFIQ